MRDLLSGVEGVEAKAMFGGYSLYKNGVIFALIADDALYFKVDDTNRKNFEARGSAPFTYESRGKCVTMSSYWEVPAEILDDREAIALWAEKSYQITRKL